MLPTVLFTHKYLKNFLFHIEPLITNFTNENMFQIRNVAKRWCAPFLASLKLVHSSTWDSFHQEATNCLKPLLETNYNHQQILKP